MGGEGGEGSGDGVDGWMGMRRVRCGSGSRSRSRQRWFICRTWEFENSEFFADLVEFGFEAALCGTDCLLFVTKTLTKLPRISSDQEVGLLN